MVFPLGLPLCPLFTSFNSIADIPLSSLIRLSAQGNQNRQAAVALMSVVWTTRLFAK
ncbi:hypothetical protein B932_3578 (plasmid) [Gluconobacter oxydans H24]|nr:hypothetical protein B932_3578 [Gluconobacter oxydans H24]